MSTQTSLYDNQIYFGITFLGKTQLIIEPDKWDTLSNHIPRDPQWYGFWSDFLEDKYGFGFSFIITKDINTGLEITGGGQLLLEIYEQYGSEAEVYFEVGYRLKNTLKQINQWRLNLATYTCGAGGDNTVLDCFRCSAEKLPFQGKLRARFSKPCTVNDYIGVDGNLLDPISSWNLRLHSKSLLEQSQGISDTKQLTTPYSNGWDSVPDSTNCYVEFIQPDLSNLISNELTQVFNQPVGLINGVTLSDIDYNIDIYKNFLCQYTALDSGLLNIMFSGSFDFWGWGNDKEMNHSLTPNISFQAVPQVVIQRLIAGIWEIMPPLDGVPYYIDTTAPGSLYPAAPPSGIIPLVTDSFSRVRCNHIPITFTSTFNNIEILANDNVYVHLILVPGATTLPGHGTPNTFVGITNQVDNYINDIKFSQLTITPGTTAPAYRIFDILTQQLENITGQKNALISNFFSPGGFGYKYLLTNGYGIRNFGGIGYKFKKDLQSTLNDLQSIFCIGCGIKKDEDGNEFLVVEGISDFFKNRTIDTFDDTFEWEDSHSSEYCYNQIEIGYTKYEGLNLVQQDEFCTSGNFLMQFLKINNLLLTAKSGIIASGYLIEEQRRNQFSANPGQSLTNDADIFIIATAEPCIFEGIGVVFDSAFLVYFHATSMSLRKGDQFTVDSGSNLGTVFTIVAEISGYPQIGLDAYNITPSPVSQSIYYPNLTIIASSPDQIFAERNQPFKICSNVIDPYTIYNGRLSIKHLLANWRPLLGVGLHFVNLNSNDLATTQIVTELAKMNALFTTQYLDSEPNKGFVGDNILVEINRENVKDYIKVGSSIFSPSASTFKVKRGWNKFDYYRKALAGETGDENVDYGGFVAKDSIGRYWFVQVMDIQNDLVKEIITFKVQKVKQIS